MIEIVKAEERHIPDICKLWLGFMKFHADIDATLAPGDDFFTKGIESASGFENEFLRPAMKSEQRLVQIALDGQKIIGYSIADILEMPNSEIRQCGFVNHLYVTESYRRQGIGEKLHAEILKWFRSRDISVVEIQLLAKNRAACSFWKKQGYGDYQHTWIRRI
ncbi:MAG: GNAT family N-acetyltransferase [Dehalococcoidales bacterium]|jgi:GNAT superfamily N-acetyltransferase